MLAAEGRHTCRPPYSKRREHHRIGSPHRRKRCRHRGSRPQWHRTRVRLCHHNRPRYSRPRPGRYRPHMQFPPPRTNRQSARTRRKVCWAGRRRCSGSRHPTAGSPQRPNCSPHRQSNPQRHLPKRRIHPGLHNPYTSRWGGSKHRMSLDRCHNPGPPGTARRRCRTQLVCRPDRTTCHH